MYAPITHRRYLLGLDSRLVRLSFAQAAIDCGSIEMFEWVTSMAPSSWLPLRALSAAAVCGNQEMLAFLLKSKECEWQDTKYDTEPWDPPAFNNTLRFVIESGGNMMSHQETFEMVKHCVDLGCPLSVQVFAAAAHEVDGPAMFCNPENCFLEQLDWLLKNNCPVDATTMQTVAGKHAKRMTRGEVSKHCPYRSKTTDGPYSINHLVGTSRTATITFPLCLIEWLHERGVPWDNRTTATAAKVGNIPLLEHLDAHGCPIDKRAFEWAARAGQQTSLEWLWMRERKAPGSKRVALDAKATLWAATGVQRETLEWLCDHGAPFNYHECLHNVMASRVKAKDEKCEGMYRRAKAMYEWLEGRGGKALIVRRLTAVLDDPHFETLPDGKLLKARRLVMDGVYTSGALLAQLKALSSKAHSRKDEALSAVRAAIDVIVDACKKTVGDTDKENVVDLTDCMGTR